MAEDRRIDDQLDGIDKLLLNALQSDFPLVSRPFVELGARLGIPEGEVVERTRRLKESGVIRQISAIFDSRALGYDSTLAAMRVPPERLDEVAAAVSEEAGVSHNYARNHDYNLWFTLTLPPGVDPRDALAGLATRVGVERWLYLPALRVFKIGVQLNMIDEEGQGSGVKGQGVEPPRTRGRESRIETLPPPDSRLSTLDSQLTPSIVRELQKDVDIVEQPFRAAAERLGMTEEELLAAGLALREAAVMRRFAAVLRHRQAGFSANGMGAWIVPEETVEEAGPTMASFPQVTHCYQRPTYPDWPYSLFTMIHARTHHECEAIAADISEKTGVETYRLLYSTKEYKKVRVRYFE